MKSYLFKKESIWSKNKPESLSGLMLVRCYSGMPCFLILLHHVLTSKSLTYVGKIKDVSKAMSVFFKCLKELKSLL